MDALPQRGWLWLAGGVLAIVVAGVVVTSALDRTAPPAPETAIQSVDEAVGLGTLDPVVLEELRGDGVSEAIVYLDTAAIIERLGQQLGRERVAERIAQLSAALAQSKQSILAGLGDRAQLVLDFRSLGAAVVAFRDERALVAVLRNPLVRAISADTPVDLPPDDSIAGDSPPVAVPSDFDGDAVYVGVLDTGIDPNMYPGKISAASIEDTLEVPPDDGEADDYGHGTAVSSVVLAYAPRARLFVADVFSWSTQADGTEKIGAKPRDSLAGMQWIIDQKAEKGYNVRAVNLSLGSGHHPPSICGSGYDFQDALYYEILPVVSSGNRAFRDDQNKPTPGQYHQGIGHPACAAGALSVGAVTTAHCPDEPPDVVADFSQSSELLGMLAPGKCVPTAGGLKNGTSFAAPAVAGTVAVLASAKADAGAEAIRNALTRTGRPITDPNSNITRNRLDVNAAVAYLLGTTEPEPGRGPIGTVRGYSVSTRSVTSLLDEVEPGTPHLMERFGVRNVGTASGTYRFEVTSADPEVASWFEFIPSSMSLEPLEQAFTSPWLEIPSTADPGSYSALITVTDAEGGVAMGSNEIRATFTVVAGDLGGDLAGTITGLVLGPLGLIAGALVLFWLYRRRRRDTQTSPPAGDEAT